MSSSVEKTTKLRAARNLMLNLRELRAGAIRLESLPPFVQIESTTKCNIACLSCRRDAVHGAGQHLHDDIMKLAIEQLLPGARELYLNGYGEPLLAPKLPDLLDAIQQFPGLDAMFFTNGTLLDAEMTRRLIDARIARVIVSIDGATKETFEKLRRGATWERLVENLESFNREKRARQSRLPELHMAIVGSTVNIDQTPLFIDLAKRFEFDNVCCQPTMWNIPPGREYLALDDDREKTVALFRKAHQRSIELGVQSNFDELARTWSGSLGAQASRLQSDSLGSTSIPNESLGAQASRLQSDSLGSTSARCVASKMRRWQNRFDNLWKSSGRTWRCLPQIILDRIRVRLQRRRGAAPRSWIPNDSPPSRCGTPWTYINIGFDGKIYPCCYNDHCMGDLSRQSVDEVWNGPLYTSLRQSLVSGHYWASCRTAACNRLGGFSESTETNADTADSAPGPAGPYNAELQILDFETVPAPGERFTVPVRIVNRSTHEWRSDTATPVNLSYHIRDDSNQMIVFDGLRTPLPPIRPRGEERVIQAAVQAPNAPGRYIIEFDLVQEGVSWFERITGRIAKLDIEIQ